ncbi:MULTISPECIES: lipopolysaccharide biosynthesis protein [unclassified Cobetia]|uniref:lipopolysaccharide biosynthesis protein n=1 Tax=unclassified Cobetia TaxID=2609414 RepID=UPI00178CF4C7|nr:MULTISPECIES: oligosaccharide flippase family protein [unclassified Cobetia]MBE2170224.1 oligosaccharide flippase family protein [Cobetia sp. 2AS1]MDH2446993.1 oligosaccharide flippase family protein [Cobetia sp. 2AS]
MKKILSNTFIKNVLVLASGTAGAQAITMAFSPVLTRLYSPEAFGILGIFSSITAVLIPLATLCIPMAIVLPKRNCDAYKIVLASLYVTLITSVIIYFLLQLINLNYFVSLDENALQVFIYLVPAAMLFTSFMEIATQCFVRLNEFKILAKISIVKSLILGTLKVIAGLVSGSYIYLLAIATLAGLFHTALSYIFIRDKVSNILNFNLKPSKYEVAGKLIENKDFAIYRAPQVAINSAGQSLPIILLAILYDPVVVGFYTLAKTVLAMPTTLMSQAIGSVFYPKFSNYYNNGRDIFGLLSKTTLSLVVLGAIPFGLIFIYGKEIFSFVFGEQWYEAGIYSQWISIWAYSGFINRASLNAITVLSYQKILLLYEVLSISLKAIGLYLVFLLDYNAEISIAVFCLISTFLNIALVIFSLIVTKKNSRG